MGTDETYTVGPGRTGPSPRSRAVTRVLLLLAALAVITTFFWFAARTWRPNPVSPENFEKIHIGMTREEVIDLLGKPGYEAMQLGLVNGPDGYSISTDTDVAGLRRKGFQDYRFQQWTSRTVSIMVVTDGEDRVVCRDAQEGRKPDWLGWLRSFLPPWWR
jgi:hypothetical protein